RNRTPGESQRQQVTSKVAGRVHQPLFACGDVQCSRVVVGSEVNPFAAAIRGGDELWQLNLTRWSNQGLRSLNHDLDLEPVLRQPELAFQSGEERGKCLDLRRAHDFGQGNDQLPERLVTCAVQRFHEELQGADAASPAVWPEGFDPNSYGWGQTRSGKALGDFFCGCLRVLILLGLRANSVAIFEINPVTLHRLEPQLALNLLVDGLKQLSWVRKAQPASELGARRRMLRHRRQGQLSQPMRGRRAKQLRPAVDGVHGLTLAGVERRLSLARYRSRAHCANLLRIQGVASRFTRVRAKALRLQRVTKWREPPAAARLRATVRDSEVSEDIHQHAQSRLDKAGSGAQVRRSRVGWQLLVKMLDFQLVHHQVCSQGGAHLPASLLPLLKLGERGLNRHRVDHRNRALTVGTARLVLQAD